MLKVVKALFLLFHREKLNVLQSTNREVDKNNKELLDFLPIPTFRFKRPGGKTLKSYQIQDKLFEVNWEIF